jgi:hypothetical protein
MPKYRSNAFLVQNGATVRPDENLILTEEQAERLGDKVTLLEEPQEVAETPEEVQEAKEPEVEEAQPEAEIEVQEEKTAPRKRSTKKDK